MAIDDVSSRLRAQLSDAAWALGVLREAGVVRPMRPDKALRLGERFVRLGTSPALASAGGAITEPDRIAIVDEIGMLSFGTTHQRSNALAWALRDAGVGVGDGVAIMCRNHRYIVEATMACAKLGAVAL
jgi:AMP-binding enzyme